MRVLGIAAVCLVVLGVSVAAPLAGPEDWDQRFGVVAGDGGGGGDPFVAMQGPQYFEPLRTAWWYNYHPYQTSTVVPGLVLFWPGYQRLYMFWRALATTPDETIQEYARAAKAADPYHTIWWAMSNEPNDYGQANQSAAGFAAIYYKHHRNLKIGDPTCKIMGAGLLNWDFFSTSCWQRGRDWYQEFRNAWYSDPTCRQYSEQNYGLSYPPQDAFNVHAYDLRGVQGTPWAPESWTYGRDQLVACHNDLQTWPETQGLQVWNTEFGGLRSATRAEYANVGCPLSLFMRDTPWIERWFWFIVNNGGSGEWHSWHNAELVDFPNTLSSLGQAYRDISLLKPDTDFHNVPYHSDFGSHPAYTRPGWTSTASVGESVTTGLRHYLFSNTTYTAGQMRGRTFAFPNKRITRVTFNYNTTYDNRNLHLALDTPSATDVWKCTRYLNFDGYADVDLSNELPASVSFGLFITNGFTFSQSTDAFRSIVSNITFYLAQIPTTPVVTVPLLAKVGDALSASWVSEDPRTGVAGYEYAIGTSPGGTDVAGWTATSASSVRVQGVPLSSAQRYYFAVKARNGAGYWSEIGISDATTAVAETAISAALGKPDGVAVGIEGIVSAGSGNLAGLFYVQSPDRSCAIRVNPLSTSPATNPGDRVQVTGTVATVSRERLISWPAVCVISSGPAPVPLGMGALLVARGDLNQYAKGVAGDGPYNVGLLVRVWGRVTKVDIATKVLYLDDGSAIADGSGNVGLRLYWGQTKGSVTPPAVGSLVMATGVSGLRSLGTDVWMRQIRLRSGADLVPL